MPQDSLKDLAARLKMVDGYIKGLGRDSALEKASALLFEQDEKLSNLHEALASEKKKVDIVLEKYGDLILQLDQEVEKNRMKDKQIAEMTGELAAKRVKAQKTPRQTSSFQEGLEAAAKTADQFGESEDEDEVLMASMIAPAIRSLRAENPSPHSDDAAVDRFAAAMKAKMADARAKGRHGWDDYEDVSDEWLASLFWGHLRKLNAGNFEDLANLLMMLWNRHASPSVLNGFEEVRDDDTR